MEWQTLEGARCAEVYEGLKSSGIPPLFSARASEVKCLSIPFYKLHRLYKISNFMTLPSFSVSFLGDEDEDQFYVLDGTSMPIHTVNRQEDLHLSEQNLADYLDFYFCHTTDTEGEEISLLRPPGDHPFFSPCSHGKLHEDWLRRYSYTIHQNTENGEFTVSGFLCCDGTLNSAEVRVSQDGHVKIVNRSMLVRDDITKTAI